MPRPVDRTTNNTAAEHVADHNAVHALYNVLEGSTTPSVPIPAGTYAEAAATTAALAAKADAAATTTALAGKADAAIVPAKSLIGAVPSTGGLIRPVYDTFTAANGTALAGRTSDSGHVWATTGAGTATIQSNAFSSTGTTYLYTDVGEKIARMEADTLNGRGALLVNKTSKAVLEDVIHLGLGAASWEFSLIHGNLNAGGTWEDIARGFYPATLTAGAGHKVAMTIAGDVVIIELPGGITVAYQHPKIAEYNGGRADFEIIGDSTERWTTVRAAGVSAEVRVPAVPDPIGANLVPRVVSVMDAASTGWANTVNSSVARVTDRSAFGAGALAVTSLAAGSAQVSVGAARYALPNGGNRHYTMQASFQMPDGLTSEEVYVYADVYDASNVAVLAAAVAAGTPTPLNANWRKNILHFYAPATATQFRPRLVMASASAAGRVFYADRVACVEGLSSLWVPPA